MAIEMLVGLNVVDEEAYESYRKAIGPILALHSGGFGYDFKVAETLESEANVAINRVFTIYFPTEDLREAFFANSDYIGIKERFFDRGVADTTIIATYEKTR